MVSPEEYRDWSAEQIEDAQKTTEATEDGIRRPGKEGFTREGGIYGNKHSITILRWV